MQSCILIRHYAKTLMVFEAVREREGWPQMADTHLHVTGTEPAPSGDNHGIATLLAGPAPGFLAALETSRPALGADIIIEFGFRLHCFNWF